VAERKSRRAGSAREKRLPVVSGPFSPYASRIIPPSRSPLSWLCPVVRERGFLGPPYAFLKIMTGVQGPDISDILPGQIWESLFQQTVRFATYQINRLRWRAHTDGLLIPNKKFFYRIQLVFSNLQRHSKKSCCQTTNFQFSTPYILGGRDVPPVDAAHDAPPLT
jgi:hypothetical protein